jgi:NAD(P)-dependent dehydrogenase (short-subunit alcohol dehydrogenase family)
MNNQTGLSKKFSLIGRTAIVTGGAGLLGSEFCRTIVDAGGNVVIADIQGKAASKLAAELPPDRDRAQAIQVDVTSKSSVDELVEAVLSSNGRIDILVNSAALDPKFDPDHVSGVSNAFEDFPLDAWEEALRVNLTGAFLCSQAVAAAMLQQGSGVIINICSTYGLVGPDQRIYERAGQPVRYKPAYYTVTKAGILGFTRYLAAYFAGKNIRVNALSPGGVLAGHDDEFVKHYSARTVLGRMAQKDELNGALLFLASDASSYMTGANLVVDGGWTAW